MPLPKSLIKRILIAALPLGAGLLLGTISTDREYINLVPEEGIQNGVVLEAGKQYEQTFAATRTSLTRLSLFLRPLKANLPREEKVEITLSKGDAVIARQAASAAFIDTEAATQFRFTPSLQTERGELITIRLTVSPGLDKAVRLQLRPHDGSFDPATVIFKINGEVQNSPAGYQVYYQYRPPFAIQIAGLLIFAALLIAAKIRPAHPASAALYVFGLTVLYLSPAWLLGNPPLFLSLITAIALGGMLVLLQKQGLSLPAILLGAHAFAFTTWFPLHVLAGRLKIMPFVLLPLLFFIPSLASKKYRLFGFALLIGGALLASAVLPWTPAPHLAGLTASPKDIFLDPNQIPSSFKFDQDFLRVSQVPIRDPDVIAKAGGWDHFGSYIGFITSVLALLGLATRLKKSWKLALVGALGLLLATIPAVTAAANTILPFPAQYAIILATFTLAYFAAQGLEVIALIVGAKTENVPSLLIYAIMAIALLDMLQVASRTLEFGLL